jgi:hypothetical protein
MTTIYLIKKTNQITGLKYLCKTIRQDWHVYAGSGHYWKRHIREHGKHIDSELIMECKTSEELKEWGTYYSELWNIVHEVDENGKKTWANLKPEQGDGGDPGPIGRQKISESHTGVKHSSERNAAKSARQKGKKKSQQWIDNRRGYSKIIYCWENLLTGQRISLTRYDFVRTILGKTNDSNISMVISGKQKSIKGWRITCQA